MSAKLVNARLFVNVNGGSTLAQSYDADLAKGSNTINLPKLGKDVSSAELDLIEDVKRGTEFGSLTLERAFVHQKGKSKGADLTVRAEKSGAAHFTVTAGMQAGVSIKHRLSITPEGVAEWSSRAHVTNSGKTALDNVGLTIEVGDTENRGGGRFFAARSAALESVDTSVSQASGSVYRFDHPQKLSLKAGESAQINLFNKDFAPGQVEKKNTFTGWGAQLWGRDSTVSEAGAVQTSYELENTKANGMGVVLPRGDVQIMRPDGTLLSNASIQDTSIGKKLVLDGGKAFDLDVTRQQTSHEVKESTSLGRNQGKMIRVEVGQELAFKNNGPVEEAIEVNERIQESQDDAKPAKISNVKLNGVVLADDAWSYDAEKGALTVPAMLVGSGQEAKLSYTLETSYAG